MRGAVAEDTNRVTTVDAFDVDCQNVRLRAGQRIAALKRLLGR